MNQLPISVEVVLALPEEQAVVSLVMDAGSTASDALAQSGLLARYPAVFAGQQVKLGIYSKVIDQPDQYRLQAGDRVEVYRPLLIDPKEARKQRAHQARQQHRPT